MLGGEFPMLNRQKRQIHRLPNRIETITAIGRHADGGNLYLSIKPNGGRSWVFLYRERGTSRLREMGLGSAGPAGVSLKDARAKAHAARTSLLNGRDPLMDKRAKQADAAGTVTFGQFADELIKAKAPAWSARHVSQWKSAIRNHAAPLRSIPVRDLSTDHVLKVLEPLWTTKPETASRLRGRIEMVLDAAKAGGRRQGDNPARWNGHLEYMLAKPETLKRGHHKAVPYSEMPAFMALVRERKSTSARALEFTVLTAVRTSETTGAVWAEINLAEKLWTIPRERMKADREHRVPLADRAIEILQSMIPAGTDPDPAAYVFPGAKRGARLSSAAMLEFVRNLRGYGATVHGLRSSFRDWAAELTVHDPAVAEMALAHSVGDKVEAAYRRGDLFQKRAAIMDDWSQYLAA
jgi:integrase